MSSDPYRLAFPQAALVLLAIAVLLLWLALVLGLLLFAWSGLMTGIWFSDPFANFRNLDDGFRMALMFQWSIYGASVLLIWGLGSATLWAHLCGAFERAANTAIWLVRALIALAVLNFLASGGTGWAGSGTIYAGLVTALPFLPGTLVSIAFLLCAEAYLKRQSESVF